MVRSLIKMLLSGAMLAGFAVSAHAADFLAQSGFGPSGDGFNPCKSGASSSAFATGTQLRSSDYSGDCVGGFEVAIDTTAKTITLNDFEAGNYETGFLQISNIEGTKITGISTISSDGLFDPAYYGDPEFFGNIPTPQLSFSNNSIGIVFSSYGQSPPQFTYGSNGTAVFAYTSSNGAVPEPATWAMMMIGFGMIGFGLRRRSKVSTNVSFA